MANTRVQSRRFEIMFEWRAYKVSSAKSPALTSNVLFNFDFVIFTKWRMRVFNHVSFNNDQNTFFHLENCKLMC